MTISRHPSALVLVISFAAAVLLTGCSGGHNRVPLGTWQDAQNQRYITIERFNDHYRALLYSMKPSSRDASQESLVHHGKVPAFIKKGILTLEVNDADIPVLYHPTKQLIVISGVNEYLRVPDELAQLTLGNLQGTN